MPSIEDLQIRFSFDGAVKQSLISNADDETKTHSIEHHFIAEVRDPLDALAGCAEALGFRSSQVSESLFEGNSYWSFDLISDRDTKLPSITRESILMLSLGEAFGATYDGWGTLIQR
jgi:regulator of RNase E activity RraB